MRAATLAAIMLGGMLDGATPFPEARRRSLASSQPLPPSSQHAQYAAIEAAKLKRERRAAKRVAAKDRAEKGRSHAP